MPRARYEIRSDVLRKLDVPTQWVSDHEGSARPPEFCLTIGMDDLGAGVGRRAPLEKAVRATTDRIGEGRVAKGELIARVEVILMLLGETSWLTKLVVREGLVPASYVRMDPVKHDAPGHVFIESLIKHVPQEAPALRYAEGDRGGWKPRERQGIRVPRSVSPLVAEERYHITHRDEAQPHHDGIFRLVEELVEELVDGAVIESGGTPDTDLIGAPVAPRKIGRPRTRTLPVSAHCERRSAGVEAS